MGYKIFGIASSEGLDRDGEKISLNGMDTSNFNFLKDEHVDGAFAQIGLIRKAKKIFEESEATDWREKKCWKSTKKPFLYFEAELLDDKNHPNAKAAAGLIDTVSREGIGNIRASIEGGVMKKAGNCLEETSALSVVLTVQPVNKDCLVFPFHDLQKSQTKYPLNDLAQIRITRMRIELKKSKQTPHKEVEKTVNDRIAINALSKEVEVARSQIVDYLEYYTKSLRTIECSMCKSKTSFSKIDSDETPNICGCCGNYFTATDYNKAFKKDVE